MKNSTINFLYYLDSKLRHYSWMGAIVFMEGYILLWISSSWPLFLYSYLLNLIDLTWKLKSFLSSKIHLMWPNTNKCLVFLKWKQCSFQNNHPDTRASVSERGFVWNTELMQKKLLKERAACSSRLPRIRITTQKLHYLKHCFAH